MKKFVPHEVLTKAQINKYKFLVIPFVIIIISFFLSQVSENSKYLSYLGLILYFFLFYFLRFKINFISINETEVVSPINGKIVKITSIENGYLLFIEKPFLASTEVVTCTKYDLINKIDDTQDRVSWEISNKMIKIFTEDEVDCAAVLIGVSPGKATCQIFIPSKYEISVNENNSLEAGVTIIAESIDSR